MFNSTADIARLSVFVPGPLVNPMNGSHGHWAKHARWARTWRERAYLALFRDFMERRHLGSGPRMADGRVPKRITFLAQTGARWDDDNLRAGMKPIRDALKDAGIIHDDGPASGHTFCYEQIVNRKERGVQITVELRDA